MKSFPWGPLAAIALAAGCGVKNDQTTNPEQGHGTTLGLETTGKTFRWGPAAPEPPLTPSPVPQMPEQPGSPMNPGDGRQASDKLVPSTANPAEPR